MVRAKELFVWSPSFKDVLEVIQCSDVNSFKNAADNNVEDIPDVNVEEESDCDAVSDTFLGTVKRSKVDVNPESSIPYPPGFTPEKGNETTMFANISQEVQEEHHKSGSCSSRKGGRPVRKEGGSILDALDDMIKFAHAESEALGLSGRILCVWDSNVFQKHHHIRSDNFVALYGMWIPKKIQIL
nr:RNA-directed DNA polymerase, eukaryota [Tanacetum cinerariifolium]